MLFFIILVFQQSQSFTLMNVNEPRFSINNVTYNVAGDSDCTNAGFTAEELLDLVEDAVELHWNTVPTSALVLEKGSVLPIDVSGDTSGAQAALRAPVNSILIGCNDTITAFI
ncbi:MAG: hypothetical protein OXB84_03110, partial [Halobacteriovoraceae bacterium]|nr:hypothetical protein [Halobacteriovoraceae bacterium]